MIHISKKIDYKNIDPNKKQEIYKDVLQRTKRALDSLNVPFFLSSGTCLGYFRDKKIIDYDYDIDIGIWRTDYRQDIVTAMANEGLERVRVWRNKIGILELSFLLPNTEIGRYAKIDIFLHYKSKAKDGKQVASWYTYAPKRTKLIRYQVTNFDLIKVDFLGMKLNVPNPTLRYIEEHYGKDWRIPKKPFTEYHYWTTPTSAKEIGIEELDKEAKICKKHNPKPELYKYS